MPYWAKIGAKCVHAATTKPVVDIQYSIYRYTHILYIPNTHTQSFTHKNLPIPAYYEGLNEKSSDRSCSGDKCGLGKLSIVMLTISRVLLATLCLLFVIKLTIIFQLIMMH
jgi:hypothetical protein